jgi:zinc/manganese transport system substrate-binding protein
MTRKNLVFNFIPPHRIISRVLRGLMAGGLTLTLAFATLGCASSSNDAGSDTASDVCPDDPVVVISTIRNWDTLVGEILPPCVVHSAILSSASSDPHEFEPTSADIATLIAADLVILNGGHIDEWAQDVLANEPQIRVLDVEEELEAAHSSGESAESEGLEEHEHSGEDEHDHSGENPHYWFSLHHIYHAIEGLARELDALYIERGISKTVDLSSVTTKFEQAQALVAEVGDNLIPGAVSESLVDYLLADAGVEDLTPAGYAHAIANESEPTAQDIADFLSLFDESKIQVFVYNSTEETDVSKQLLEKAQTSVYGETNQAIRIVDVPESIPDGQNSLIDWWITVFHEVRGD